MAKPPVAGAGATRTDQLPVAWRIVGSAAAIVLGVILLGPERRAVVVCARDDAGDRRDGLPARLRRSLVVGAAAGAAAVGSRHVAAHRPWTESCA